MPETTPPMTKVRIQFACEQLREWGGLSETEIQRIYNAEMQRLEDGKAES